ncbi:MAG: NAD(P)H-quinone oxidoreductase subunit D4, partial [Cyanobacteria bacterium J06639_16]
GSFSAFGLQTLLCMVGSGLTAVYFLLLVNRVFFGRLSITTPSLTPEPDVWLPVVGWRDRTPALFLAFLITLFGLLPNWVIRWSEATSTALVNPPSAVVAQGIPSKTPWIDIAAEHRQP